MLGTPTRDRRAERREATRQEILAAAWNVAHEGGLSALTLRDVAARVGMQAPSLYSHFPSKNAIYDAMFAQAWAECEATLDVFDRRRSRSPRAALKSAAMTFFDFAVADPARTQLMTQRTIPGFEPTPESYAPSVRVLDRTRQFLRDLGCDDPQALDIYTALISGLVDQQMANDPGGDRWRRLLDRVIDMFADEIGLPGTRRRRRQ